MKRILMFLILFNTINLFALPKMKFIPEGKYNYDDTEITQEGFYISETKITVAQWKEYLIDTKNEAINEIDYKMRNCVDNRSLQIEDNYPVWALSYLQIVDFCNWLSEKNKLKKCYTKRIENKAVVVDTDYSANGYRLPTLREWYYVSELWMNKDDSYYEDVNILKNETIFERDYPYTIDYEKNNSFGIKDPLGNIYELCNDYYLKGENLILLKTNKFGPATYTPDSDQIYFNEPLTANYIHVGGTYCDTAKKVKEKFIWGVNLLSSEFFSFRVVKCK